MGRDHQIRTAVLWYLDLLGLSHWDVTIKFGYLDGGGSECRSEPRYLRADLIFDLDSIPDTEVADYALHEVLHLKVDPLWQFAEGLIGDDPRFSVMLEDAGEAVVTALERMPVWKTAATRPPGVPDASAER